MQQDGAVGHRDTTLNSDSRATGAWAQPAGEAAAAGRPVYRDATIPAGAILALSLTSSVASDTSAVEDAVTAELTRAVRFDGRDVLPAGAQLAGVVTDVDDSGRMKGRAMIAFRFTSLRTGDQQYDVQAATLLHLAAAKGDATTIGIGAGAIIGSIPVGKDGTAKGADVGGGAGTGVVLATKGRAVSLGRGTEVTSELTAAVKSARPSTPDGAIAMFTCGQSRNDAWSTLLAISPRAHVH